MLILSAGSGRAAPNIDTSPAWSAARRSSLDSTNQFTKDKSKNSALFAPHEKIVINIYIINTYRVDRIISLKDDYYILVFVGTAGFLSIDIQWRYLSGCF